MYSQTVGGHIILNHQCLCSSPTKRLFEHTPYKFGTAHKTESKGTLFNQDFRKFTFQILAINLHMDPTVKQMQSHPPQ